MFGKALLLYYLRACPGASRGSRKRGPCALVIRGNTIGIVRFCGSSRLPDPDWGRYRYRGRDNRERFDVSVALSLIRPWR